MRQKNKPSKSAVVGVVDSVQALSVAHRLPVGSLDFLEWRADCMPLDQPLPKSRFPWILTVRHPLEGGGGNLSPTERKELFAAKLPEAGLVDIELRSIGSMSTILESARDRQIPVIASFHDFKKTPPVKKLRELARRAQDSGADVFKIATWTTSPADVARLLDLFQTCRIPLAVMGMGPLGPGSRVLFAQCGSVLNYGWLHRPNVAGQWPARELKRILTAP
ncbi:MAG: type I 3-dehydroquinate dehydratase [Terrimicrobiaceae bacterium]